METKVIAGGRKGIFEIEKKRYFAQWTLSIEPWAGLYYVFHGCCLPLVFERVVGEYRSHRARAIVWKERDVADLWNKTKHLWIPVLDWVNEKDFAYYIGFRFHPCRIEWHWTMQLGDTKEMNQCRARGLQERFDILGVALRNMMKTEQDNASDASQRR